MPKQNSKNNKVLLHACCAPCLTVSAERLGDFDLSIFWYNPNIEPEEEHDKRFLTLKEFASQAGLLLVRFDYDYSIENRKWHEFVAGLESEPEGGKRCEKCFEFRLKPCAKMAGESNFDAICTTLTVSPHKDSVKVIKAGELAGKQSGIPFLPEDFKKNAGYQRSIELSKQYNLYRQNYCGCRYSIKDT